MWNLRMRNIEECRSLRDSVEEAASRHDDAVSVESLTEELPAEARKHLENCAACRQALEDLVATKELLQAAASFSAEQRPWFASRVMAAIAAHERELAQRVSAWTEFPRFASRLAWVAAILLLAGTTWFYQAFVRAPSYVPSGQESIFEAPQQTTPDDVLVSMAGDRR